MSALHTLNGAPIDGAVRYGNCILIQHDTFIEMGTEITNLRVALREALAMLDASRFGARPYRCLTPIEEKRLEELVRLYG
jgi:hypothetical protein